MTVIFKFTCRFYNFDLFKMKVLTPGLKKMWKPEALLGEKYKMVQLKLIS